MIKGSLNASFVECKVRKYDIVEPKAVEYKFVESILHSMQGNSLQTSRKHSSLCKESPAEVMLFTFVLKKTTFGTARSKTEDNLNS